jgi:hypothetical protein
VFYALDPAKGKGRELFRTGPALNPAEDGGWDLSPDGSTVALLKLDAQNEAFQIQVRSLAGGASRELDIGGWGHIGALNATGYYIRWAADGRGWYVSTGTYGGAWTLLKSDLRGKTQLVTHGDSGLDAMQSPDGRHSAMMGWVPASNVWMLRIFETSSSHSPMSSCTRFGPCTRRVPETGVLSVFSVSAVS